MVSGGCGYHFLTRWDHCLGSLHQDRHGSDGLAGRTHNERCNHASVSDESVAAGVCLSGAQFSLWLARWSETFMTTWMVSTPTDDPPIFIVALSSPLWWLTSLLVRQVACRHDGQASEDEDNAEGARPMSFFRRVSDLSILFAPYAILLIGPPSYLPAL